MKKRTAEKIISRSILVLAVYRKSTMGRALTRRPRFCTVSRRTADPVAKRVRLEFAQERQSRLILPAGEIPERSFT